MRLRHGILGGITPPEGPRIRDLFRERRIGAVMEKAGHDPAVKFDREAYHG